MLFCHWQINQCGIHSQLERELREVCGISENLSYTWMSLQLHGRTLIQFILTNCCICTEHILSFAYLCLKRMVIAFWVSHTSQTFMFCLRIRNGNVTPKCVLKIQLIRKAKEIIRFWQRETSQNNITKSSRF